MYFNLDFSFHHLTRHSHKDVDISEVVEGICYERKPKIDYEWA